MIDLVVVLAVKDSEDSKEQIQDIEIETDAGGDLFLNMIMSHDQLRVHEDVSTENECGNHAIYQLDRLSAGKESSHESEDDKNPQRAKKVWHPASEVVLGLTRKKSQTNEDTDGQNQRLQNDAAFVERCNDTDTICFETCEYSQEEHVGRVRFAFPVCEEHEANRSKQGHPHHPTIRLNPVAIVVGKEG